MIDVQEYILSKFPGKSFNSAGNMHATCPFHDDGTKSFSINNKGMFICGSTKCGVKGNFAYFYKLCEGLTWKQVQKDLKIVAPKDNLDVSSLFSIPETESVCVVNSYPPDTEPVGVLDYFTNRGFSEDEQAELCDKFGLRYGVDGYHEGIDVAGTLVVPIYDPYGNYRTFQVRYLDEDKWTRWKNPLNSPLQDLLYGAWLLSKTEEPVWVVEGASDVWNVTRFGYPAVGLFTKEASYAQMQTLYDLHRKLGVHYVVCLDGDAHSHHSAYGKDFCLKLNNEILAFGIPSSISYLKKHEDPGGLSLERFLQLREEVV